MIKKAQDFAHYEQDVEYEDGECWDFIGYKNDVSFNEIIAKGINFQKTIIHQDDNDWLCHIEYAQVIDQDNEKTVMYSRLLTNYDTDDINQFELDCDSCITIHHNKELSQIKNDYKNENKLLEQFQNLLETKGYEKEIPKCINCDECYDCLNRANTPKYNKITLFKTFNDNQTIGEAKRIFDDDCAIAKEFSNKFFKAKTCKSLYFTEKGALAEIEITHYIK